MGNKVLIFATMVRFIVVSPGENFNNMQTNVKRVKLFRRFMVTFEMDKGYSCEYSFLPISKNKKGKLVM